MPSTTNTNLYNRNNSQATLDTAGDGDYVRSYLYKGCSNYREGFVIGTEVLPNGSSMYTIVNSSDTFVRIVQPSEHAPDFLNMTKRAVKDSGSFRVTGLQPSQPAGE